MHLSLFPLDEGLLVHMLEMLLPLCSLVSLGRKIREKKKISHYICMSVLNLFILIR